MSDTTTMIRCLFEKKSKIKLGTTGKLIVKDPGIHQYYFTKYQKKRCWVFKSNSA